MEQGGSTSNNGVNNIIAPFVMKTYQIVSDPSTDHLICWGRANNSFVVLEPLEFSHRILPSFFKHNNFSSFVRQLNTYGFRKVDPDKWEFANEWFLRGQKHLLSNITRKKHTTRPNHHLQDFNDHDLLEEIQRLKDEQKTLDDELKGINQRLKASEKRPQQMMALLCKVVENPDILPRVIMEHDRAKYTLWGGGEEGGAAPAPAASPEKRRRLLWMTPSTSPSTSEEDEGPTIRAISSSCKGKLEVETFSHSIPLSPNTCNSSMLLNNLESNNQQYNYVSVNSNPLLPLDMISNFDSLQMGMDRDSSTYVGQYPNYMFLKEDNPSYLFSLLD